MRSSFLKYLGAACVLATGCTEDPSYYLRWKIASIEGTGDPREPDNARICADVGLGQLRLSTYEAGTNVLADRRLIPCASPEFPDGSHPGPELEEGDYDVVLEAVRDTGDVWVREFCSPSQVPELWDPQVPAGPNAPDDVDGTLRCEYRDIPLSCYDPGDDCTAGSFGCRCRTEKEQMEEGDPACDGGNDCTNDQCLPPDCEGAAGCACRDPGDDPVCDDGNACLDGHCVPSDDGLCGDVQSYCALEPSRPAMVRRWYCQYAADTAQVTIAGDNKPRLDDFVLVSPPQCDDGVDNDADGLTDLGDPACLLSPLVGHEIDDKALSSISVSVSFLDQNPNVNCPGIGIGRLHLELDDGSGDPEQIGDISCDTPTASFPSVSRALPEGEYVLRVTGIQSGTEDVPATTPKESAPFQVDADTGTFVKTTIDIGPDDLLTPLDDPARLLFKYQGSENQTRSCTPYPGVGGDLVVGRVEFVMLERSGDDWVEMDPAALMFDIADLTPSVDGNRITIDCPGKPVVSAGLSWGNYAVAARALELDSATACFEITDMEPFRLAPGDDANEVVLPRLLEGDPALPPAACVDCEDDGDCAGGVPCIDGVCEGP